MLGKPINLLGSTMIWWSMSAVEMVPRSDRKQYRAKRPDYGQHRKRAIVGMPRRVTIIRSSRRCAPRLTAKPAIYRMRDKLLVHPAFRAKFEHHFSEQHKA